MNSYEIGNYKQKIIRHLIDDPDIVRLVDPNNEAEYPDDLIYTNLFPFGRIPDTEQEVRVYITVVVNVPSIDKRNDLIRNVDIKVRIYAHEDLMRVSGSGFDRIDLLSAKVDSLLNESYDFGIGYVTLISNTEHTLDSKHHYRELIFRTDGINSRREGAKQWQS